MNLILLEAAEVSAGDVSLSGVRAEHLLKVLKVARGHTVRVGIVDGPFGVATVHSIADGVVTLRCVCDGSIPVRPRVDVLLALPRPKVMRRLWAQLAALGVGRILLTSAARVERNYFDTHVLTPSCYRPLLVEGLQQARDTRLPIVSIHRQLKVLVEDDLDRLFSGGVRLVSDPSAADSPAAGVRGVGEQRVLIAIGPEGGWNDFERNMLASHGFRAVGLGERTLRTDTACIALLAVVHDCLRREAP